MSTFPNMTRYLAPYVREGRAVVEHFTVPKHGGLGAIFYGADTPAPGTYVRLKELPPDGDDGRSVLWMSDTHFEHRTNWTAVHHAHGRVLVAGLGIGMVTVAMLEKAEVAQVHVVERSPDIVAAVASQFATTLPKRLRQKLLVEIADIWTFAPAGRYDVIYFDIWPDICTDYIAEMNALKRAFRKHLVRSPESWIGCWAEAEFRYRRERERRAGW